MRQMKQITAAKLFRKKMKWLNHGRNDYEYFVGVPFTTDPLSPPQKNF